MTAVEDFGQDSDTRDAPAIQRRYKGNLIHVHVTELGEIVIDEANLEEDYETETHEVINDSRTLVLKKSIHNLME